MKNNNNRLEMYMGQRLRQRRLLLGMAATELAEQLGISAAELNSYEEGRRRMPPLRLASIASHLQVSIAFFFEADMPQGDSGPPAGIDPWFEDFLAREMRNADPLRRAWLEEMFRRAAQARPPADAAPEADARSGSKSETAPGKTPDTTPAADAPPADAEPCDG